MSNTCHNRIYNNLNVFHNNTFHIHRTSTFLMFVYNGEGDDFDRYSRACILLQTCNG
uniref:Uncharacterized protein n=1 Tax=Rhizophagus irregularis (strain DAOM 181602 / DAOM 197198 / MUCL 43194) TaxID=747089 RepID=U9TYU2_RHIID